MADLGLGFGPDSAAVETRSLLVLRHEPSVHLGCFEEALQMANIPFVYSDLGDDPDLGPHTGIIVMGGAQSANDRELATELRFIQGALEAKTPVLGICLGAQLIARALGAEVYRNPETEMGWAPVYLTEAGGSDPVLGRLPSPTTFFHWHNETFLLPPGAVSLAYSDKCRQQAFRFQDTVYGVQFHPEVTPEMIADWSADFVNCGDVLTPGAPLDPNAVDSGPMAQRILEGWLDSF